MAHSNGEAALRAALDMAEAIQEAEMARLQAEIIEARLNAERQRQAEATLLGVKRSKLSPAEKSRIIRARGKAFYDSLDWA